MANLVNFFYLTKNNVIHMCPEFGEDISFRSRVIALSEMAPPLSNLFTPLCKRELKFQLFSIIIDIHLPENISAVVWFDRAKNLGLVRKSRF